MNFFFQKLKKIRKTLSLISLAFVSGFCGGTENERHLYLPKNTAKCECVIVTRDEVCYTITSSFSMHIRQRLQRERERVKFTVKV